jgi:hypothetical protein
MPPPKLDPATLRWVADQMVAHADQLRAFAEADRQRQLWKTADLESHTATTFAFWAMRFASEADAAERSAADE